MSAPASEVAESVLAIADLFARVGTSPLVDWYRPSILLTHPLQRTNIVPYVRGGDRWTSVALERPLWISGDPLEERLVGEALGDLVEDYRAAYRVEQIDFDRWSAEAFKWVEIDDSFYPMKYLTLVQWWLEDAAREALPRLAAAMGPNLDRLAPPRALVLRHAFALLGDGPDADGTFGERVELAAVESGHVTLASGEERRPVLLRYDEDDERLEVLTLIEGFDGRTSRNELDDLRRVVAGRARGREGVQVVDAPGELVTAIGVVTKVDPSVGTATLRRVFESHLDVARADGGMKTGRA